MQQLATAISAPEHLQEREQDRPGTKAALVPCPKVLLTATSLQDCLLELSGPVSVVR